MNGNKAIALEILKLYSEQFDVGNEKEIAEKYNEILDVIEKHSDSKASTGAKKEEQVEELTIQKDFILRFEFGTFRVMEDTKIQVVEEKVITGGLYGIGGPALS